MLGLSQWNTATIARKSQMTTASWSCLLCLLLAEPGPEYVLKVEPATRISAVLESSAENAQLEASEWILYAAKPPVLPCQTDISASLEPSGRATVERGPLRRPLLWTRLPVKGRKHKSGIDVTVKYRATLHSRRLVERRPSAPPADVPPLSAKQRRDALAKTRLIDYATAPFPQWLEVNKLDRRDDEGTVDYARRIFLTIKRNFKYEYRSKMDRHASVVCRQRKSDCGGLCAVFVAVMRANDVPARLLAGRWAKSSRTGHDLDGVPYFQTHVKAEFFAEGVGWVPVDLACAINRQWFGELRHFGNDPGDFLVMHVDDHVMLNTIHFGRKSLAFLQGIAYWVVASEPAGGLEIQQRWQVRKLPISDGK